MTYFTTSDGVGIDYTLHRADGAAPPILLVMGFAMPGHVWRFIIPHLDPNHPVVWYDHRGAGRSDAPDPKRNPYSMARLAQDAVELMDHLGWASAHVVGVSMGGMVAQHIALDHGARVRSLTLMATHAGGLRNRMPTARGLWHFTRTLVARGPSRFGALARLLFPDTFRRQVGDAYLEKVLAEDLALPPTPRGRAGQLQAVMGHDTRPRLGELARLPTLVVRPDLDLLIRPRCSAELHAGIPGSELLTIADAGHGLIRQSADALARAMHTNFARADLG